MINAKAKVTEFIAQLIPYDYILFASVLALFLITLLLAIALYKKLFLSIFLIIVSFFILLLGPTLGYIELHKWLFKTTHSIDIVKELEFSHAVIVSGEIKNVSKRNFKSCEVEAAAYKVNKYSIVTQIYKLNPFKRGSIVINKPILKSESSQYKVILEPFNYSKDFNVSVDVQCK
ncbi:MAG: DUF2393 family protein [Campylobacterota bacterium]|nr:DUF2393 family protein [Campylobacterota bacterium]